MQIGHFEFLRFTCLFKSHCRLDGYFNHNHIKLLNLTIPVELHKLHVSFFKLLTNDDDVEMMMIEKFPNLQKMNCRVNYKIPKCSLPNELLDCVEGEEA